MILLLATICALLPPFPPGAKPMLKSPKDAATGTSAPMARAPLAPTYVAPALVTNQPPIAVIQWYIAPGAADADPGLTNGVHCDAFNEGDALRVQFFGVSNVTYEVQVKAKLGDQWRMFARMSALNGDTVAVRYPFQGLEPREIPSRFFRVVSN